MHIANLVIAGASNVHLTKNFLSSPRLVPGAIMRIDVGRFTKLEAGRKLLPGRKPTEELPPPPLAKVLNSANQFPALWTQSKY